MKKTILLFAVCLCAAACQTLPTSSEYLARGDGYFKDGKRTEKTLLTKKPRPVLEHRTGH